MCGYGGLGVLWHRVWGVPSPEAPLARNLASRSRMGRLELQKPCTDSWGKALQRDSPFYGKKGEPLTEHGYRAIIWSIQGDHEFFSNTLGLPHWRKANPCDSQPEAESFEKTYKTDSEEAIARPILQHPLFFHPQKAFKPLNLQP